MVNASRPTPLGSTLHHRHVRRLMGHYGAPWAPMSP
jgi:hypothetical protein